MAEELFSKNSIGSSPKDERGTFRCLEIAPKDEPDLWRSTLADFFSFSNDVEQRATEFEENKEEETVYAEVKAKEGAVTQQSPATAVGEIPAPHSQPFRGVAVCLGVLCVLLVSAIIPLCFYFMTVFTKLARELAANQDLMNLNSNLSTANHILQNVSTVNRCLEAEKEALSRERDRLNWILRVIYQLDDFPVKKYCSEKDDTGERACNSCQDGWILFKSSCYQILYAGKWKTWEQSQQYCKQQNGDLAIIGSQEEQEFIHNHTSYYYDEFHGYWIGLTDTAEDGQCLWVNGSHQSQTDGFWNHQTGGKCVLTVPKNTPLANWNAEWCGMKNRWICESRALIWSD